MDLEEFGDMATDFKLLHILDLANTMIRVDNFFTDLKHQFLTV
jgi:hypothetical protein